MPLIDRILKRLSYCSQFLSYDGRLLMVNAILSSLPTFLMSCIKLYKGIITEADKYRRHCFWRGKDLDNKNPPLAAWMMLCKPKLQGGLGIIDLEVQNDSLLMKMVHKSYNCMDIPWVKLVWESYYQQGLPPTQPAHCSFWWRGCLKLIPKFKELASCVPASGHTILFWEDIWKEQALKFNWPHLYSFCKSPSLSMQLVLNTSDISSMFHLPLSLEAFEQFQQMQDMINTYDINPQKDQWQFPKKSSKFTVKVPIIYFWVVTKLFLLLPGYGSLAVNLNTRSFFGC